MFEDKRKFIIILLVAGIVLVVVWFLWLWLRPKPAPINSPAEKKTTVQAENKKIEVAPIEPASQERVNQEKSYPLAVKQLAMSFAERYGSYSTDEPVKNLSDLKVFMTPDFAQKALVQAQSNQVETVFAGYSAKALTADLKTFSETKAEVIVGLQIEQTAGLGAKTNILYKKLSVQMIKTANEWKVDGATWQ